MNITTQQKPGGEMVVKAVVTEADYAPEVDKSLKEYRRKANVPGFRPGMVPMGIINKMYRKGVVAEQAYRKANEAVFKYLEDNKVDIMGDVMPSDEQGELNFEDGAAEHEFVFEVGIAPVVDVTLGEGDKLTRYKIKPAKDMHEGYRANFLRRYSRPEPTENADGADASTDGAADPKAERPAPKFIEPELNEEFFKMAFPDGRVTDVAGLDKFIDESIAADLDRESDYLLFVQLKNHILAKANLHLPEEFLKKWLYAINEGKFTMEEIEKDFAGFLRMMAWNLVQRHFAEKLGIEIKQDDMLAEAKNIARMQFAQYGMSGVPDDTIAGFASSILQNKEEAQKIYERVREEKILAALLPTVKVSDKSVSVEEFRKIAAES